MILEACQLCPRKCGVNRRAGEKGFCKAGSELKVARAALHHWEEPCLSGTKGSGTIFFSYCTLQCVYCQNHHISTGGNGTVLTEEELADHFLRLQDEGAHNINLVTPTHYLIPIRDAIRIAKNKGLHLPIVYNTSGYERVESLKLLEGLIDVYLPDFKYFSKKYANLYSKAPHYVDYAKEAIEEMVRQVGEPVFDEEGMMIKGVMIRHLMLPGLLFDTKKIIDYIYETYGNQVYISLMNQYTPIHEIRAYPKLNEKLNPRHYEYMVDYAIGIGIENGFIQEGETASESFIPPFHEGL